MLDDLQDQAQRSMGDYWAIAIRRRWWVLVPLFLCWLTVWSVGWLLPATYQSDALILVEQQKIPEQYVVPNVNISLQDRLQSMTQQILSRTRLQATIDRFHLYPQHSGLRGLLRGGDPVEQMRKDIQIDLVQPPGHPNELTAFKIRYSTGSAELAQQVNSELTGAFIDENLKSQQQLSESTTAFLANELASARTKLLEQEAKVRTFKAQHLGDLPSQLESNVQILSGLQAQLQGTQHALDAAKQQRLYLESLQQQYQAVQTGLSTTESTGTPPEALGKELENLRRRLADARSLYTDNYPDVVALKDEIAKTEKLKKQIEDEIAANQQDEKSTKNPGMSAAGTSQSGTPSAMMQIQSQLKANQFEIQNYQQREKALESQIAGYQARLNLTPATEQQMAEISRGYEESKANYNSLLQKQLQSQLATSLEQRQQGEQFRVIDPASFPAKPSAPNHLLVSLGGLAFGLAVGFSLTAVLEMTDVRIQNEKELKEILPVRVLVGIPHLSTVDEDRHKTRVKLMEIGAVAAAVILMLAGNLYAFLKG
jgi:polysaccharide chain length determinant protein (PEP-CTERM system associated)